MRRALEIGQYSNNQESWRGSMLLHYKGGNVDGHEIPTFMFQIHFGACILRAIEGSLRQNCDYDYRDMHMRHFDGAKLGFARGTDECPMDQ